MVFQNLKMTCWPELYTVYYNSIEVFNLKSEVNPGCVEPFRAVTCHILVLFKSFQIKSNSTLVLQLTVFRNGFFLEPENVLKSKSNFNLTDLRFSIRQIRLWSIPFDFRIGKSCDFFIILAWYYLNFVWLGQSESV